MTGFAGIFFCKKVAKKLQKKIKISKNRIPTVFAGCLLLEKNKKDIQKMFSLDVFISSFVGTVRRGLRNGAAVSAVPHPHPFSSANNRECTKKDKPKKAIALWSILGV